MMMMSGKIILEHVPITILNNCKLSTNIDTFKLYVLNLKFCFLL